MRFSNAGVIAMIETDLQDCARPSGSRGDLFCLANVSAHRLFEQNRFARNKGGDCDLRGGARRRRNDERIDRRVLQN